MSTQSIAQKLETLATLTTADCTHVFAVPGSMSIVDLVRPDSGLSWFGKHTLEQVQERYPGAVVMLYSEWVEAANAKQRTSIEWIETTEAEYHEMLNVLFPRVWEGGSFLVGEEYDHDVMSGQARYSCHVAEVGTFKRSNRPITVSEFRAMFPKKAEV